MFHPRPPRPGPRPGPRPPPPHRPPHYGPRYPNYYWSGYDPYVYNPWGPIVVATPDDLAFIGAGAPVSMAKTSSSSSPASGTDGTTNNNTTTMLLAGALGVTTVGVIVGLVVYFSTKKT